MSVLKLATVVAIATGSVAGSARAQASTDACATLIPPALRAAVEKQFPTHRPPAESDNVPEDVRDNRGHGGSGCLGLALGDYYGKKQQDYALLLTSRSSKQTLLVVATRTRGAWRVERLRDWGSAARAGLYVDSVPSGSFKRTAAADGPLSEPGEVIRYSSQHAGVVSGTMESSGVAYFFTGKRWVHVWVSN